MEKRLNISYAGIQATYWMVYAVVGSFASVFLLARGYSNSEIGVILAVANVVAVVLQPMVADLADRSKKISLVGIIEIMTIIMLLFMAGLFVFQQKTLALSVIFLLLLAWHTSLQPLINSLNFKLEESGLKINFGVARSMGSLAYSILCAFMGTLVETYSVSIMPVSGVVVILMLMASLLATKKMFDKAAAAKVARGETETAAVVKEEVEEEINLIAFLKRNKVFLLLNIGVLGIFFSNQVLNNYMIQIVSNVGGDSEDMGRILSIMAFLEIPLMVCAGSLRRKFSCELMLKVAAMGFTVKIALHYIATTVGMIYFAQLFQLISFGLFLPVMVMFIDEVMSKGEAVKGQAFFTMMTTVASIIGSLIGGVILDISGAKMLTLIATVFTAVGTLILIATVDKVKRRSI
ncbi:MAG: MFS transporter [Firmicutes bacterium]|nr:MFS transporter [Bacillota bacterium]